MRFLNRCLIFSFVCIFGLLIPLASAAPGGNHLPGGYSWNQENATGNHTQSHPGQMPGKGSGIDNATVSPPPFHMRNVTTAGNAGPDVSRYGILSLDNRTRPDNQTPPDFGNSHPVFNGTFPGHLNQTPPGNHTRMDLDTLSLSGGTPPGDENRTSQDRHPRMGPWNTTGPSGTLNPGPGNMTTIGLGFRDGDWNTEIRNETRAGNYSMNELMDAFFTLFMGVSSS